MKKVFIVWCMFIFCILILNILFHIPKKVPVHLLATPLALSNPTSQPHGKNFAQENYLFVPYWSFDSQSVPATYSGYIYFGIVPTLDGIDTNGSSYTKITTFVSLVPSQKEKLLAIQMVNASVNEQVLHDVNLQKKIFDQSLQIATNNGFSGIILDFEYSALAFDSVTKSTTQFITNFAQTAHKGKIKFYTAVYGDVFYRMRPYNVAAIGKQSDGIYVMAYDFHKASGDPGANFPFKKDASDDYDFTQMVSDFIKQVPVSKLTIVFGMFGYDWKVNVKGQSIASGIALSNNQIQRSILNACGQLHCHTQRSLTSMETQVSYIDRQQINHLIWYEDSTSLQTKQTYLRLNGIIKNAFWANGYF